MKQLTIAVPAYNAEAYIRKCLESMAGIDKRLEIIVINDGSMDGTGPIAQEFAVQYPTMYVSFPRRTEAMAHALTLRSNRPEDGISKWWTRMYLDSGLRLTEGVFYEDQEYASLPFACVDKVLILPFYFYVYLIGNANQSVAFHNQVKRIGHIETVAFRILRFRKEMPGLAPAAEYILRKRTVVAVSFFAVALVKNPDKKAGMWDAEHFRTLLEAEEPEVMWRIEKKYRMLLLLRRLHIPPAFYQGILDTSIYKKFRRFWMN